MSYYRDDQSRGIGAVAALDMGPTARISGALQRTAPPATRTVVRPGVVPPLVRPGTRTGISVDRLTPMSPTPRPAGISVVSPPPALRPVAVVSRTGQPMQVVSGSPPRTGGGIIGGGPGGAARLATAHANATQGGVFARATAGAPAVKVTVNAQGKATVSNVPWAVPSAPALAKLDKFVHSHPGLALTMDTHGQIHAKGIGTAHAGKPKLKPVWVTKAKDCPKGYFIKKTVVIGFPPSMKFWCWPNPVSKAKRIVKGVSRKKPTHKITVTPGAARGGVRVGHLKVRGPVVPAGNLPPGTSVDTPAGIGCVVPTPQGNVVVPGATPAPDVPVGSTVTTDAGPATVVATPAGNIAIPESMAPPEDEWANDAQIDALLSETKEDVAAEMGPSADTAPGAAVVDEGAPPVATPAEAADMKKGGIGKLAMVGGAGWLILKFFL